MDAGALDVTAVSLRRRVINRERESVDAGEQRLEHRGHQERGDEVGDLAGGGHAGVARAEVIAEIASANPTRDCAHSPPLDRADEQPDEPNAGTSIDGGRQSGIRAGPRSYPIELC